MRWSHLVAAVTCALVGCRAEPPAPTASPAGSGAVAGSAAGGSDACPGALLPIPPDLAARGPWPVGARTVRAGDLTLEVWYPAVPGSERGAPPARYDLRTAMPPADAARIPDADNAWLPCECARDLPPDLTHGPYPVVLFFHGAASFRAQSAFLATHWASRGFVVVAPDVEAIGLAAALGSGGALPLGVPHAALDVIEHPGAPDPLAFVRPQLGARLAVAGHSLGNLMAGALGDRPELAVHIVMAGAPGAPSAGATTLVIAGDHDHIAPPGDGSAAPGARRAILHRAGHLAFTDLCGVGAEHGGALAIARAHGVTIPPILETLARDGCGPDDAPFATTAPALRALTAGVLEERLQCRASATAALAALPRTYDLELSGSGAP